MCAAVRRSSLNRKVEGSNLATLGHLQTFRPSPSKIVNSCTASPPHTCSNGLKMSCLKGVRRIETYSECSGCAIYAVCALLSFLCHPKESKNILICYNCGKCATIFPKELYFVEYHYWIAHTNAIYDAFSKKANIISVWEACSILVFQCRFRVTEELRIYTIV